MKVDNVFISQDLAQQINHYLKEEPKSREECLSEDATISVTANFGNGIEMDIKCCGVKFYEEESNLAWTEAVLFDHGSEVACTEPEDEFLGEWTLEYDGETYTAFVEEI